MHTGDSAIATLGSSDMIFGTEPTYPNRIGTVVILSRFCVLSVSLTQKVSFLQGNFDWAYEEELSLSDVRASQPARLSARPPTRLPDTSWRGAVAAGLALVAGRLVHRILVST